MHKVDLGQSVVFSSGQSSTFKARRWIHLDLMGEVLLSHVLGKDRIYLYTHYDQPLIQEELDAFRPLVQQRAKGYSVASITGQKEFMGLYL